MKTEKDNLDGSQPSSASKCSVRVIAVITYNLGAPEIRVELTDLCKNMLASLTDFELSVFATEAGIQVRQRLEMPPSPGPNATAPC